MSGDLDPAQLERLAKEFDADPRNRLLQNAVTRNKVDQVARDHRVAVALDRSVSHQLDDWSVTNQKQTGRCWMFAGLNLLRVGAAEKLGLKDFEFSQNYLMFWDKIEKANYFLEAIIATADRDVDDRTVAHLMSTPDRGRRPVEHVRRPGPQARPGAEVGDAGDRARRRTPRSSTAILSAVLRQAARDLRERPPPARRPRAAPSQGAHAGRRVPHALHPPRHAAQRVLLAVDATRTRASTATVR